MLPAEEPLRAFQKILSSFADNPREILSWQFITREFSVTPIFSDFEDQMTLVFETLFSGDVSRVLARIDYRLPDEDRVFGRLYYLISAVRGATESILSSRSHRDRQVADQILIPRRGLDAAIAALSDQLTGQINISSRITSELIELDLEIPVTDIEVQKELAPVDFEELRMKLADEDMRVSLLRMFSEQTPLRFQEWEQAYRNGRIAEAHRIMHSIKGSALNISAQRLAKYARRLEMQLKNNNTEDAEELSSRVRDELDEAVSIIKNYLSNGQEQ
jgi:HPt (histidine-containing phosphotransfer) domain-containing protein